MSARGGGCGVCSGGSALGGCLLPGGLLQRGGLLGGVSAPGGGSALGRCEVPPLLRESQMPVKI